MIQSLVPLSGLEKSNDTSDAVGPTILILDSGEDKVGIPLGRGFGVDNADDNHCQIKPEY